MLKRRVAIALLFNDGVLFRTKKFVPDYRYCQSFLGVSAVDEVFLIDITRAGPSEASRKAMAAYAEGCFSPCTMGGHIRGVDDVKRFMDLGADKVVLGEIVLDQPRFLGVLREKYGSQVATVALDLIDGKAGSARTGKTSPLSPVGYAVAAEKAGAGEIFLQDRDLDGSLGGYNVAVCREIADAVRLPVVVGTSCGNAAHMRAAFDAHACGAATANIHHFTDAAIRGFKAQLGGYVRQ